MNAFKCLPGFVKTAALAVSLCGAAAVLADPPTTSTTVYPSVPPNISTSGSKPMLMLTASKDHTLFGPMYTDFEDLDGDGTLDVTFKPDFKYYGYFDATKCYTYSSSTFTPDSNATDNIVNTTVNGTTVTTHRYSCGGSDQWSGNFLNWATMTRLDIVRKMLYGGQRYTDSATETILQVARLSKDSHSFVKYYRGTDVRDYTPFSTTVLTKTGGSNPGVYAGISMCIRASANDNGISGTPQMRLAKGNYRLWATVEGGSVCEWSGTFGNKLSRYYGGTAAYQGSGGVNHESSPPSQGTDGVSYGTSSDVNLRVKACVTAKLGEERCQAYGSSTVVYKPVGLLQDFGTPVAGAAAARTEFGLITGSYDNNLTAGALRKNMTDLSDEINPTTGQFCFSSGASCPTTMASDSTRTHTSSGAIKALDQINLYGKTGGNYTDSGTQLPSELTNGKLSAWGNPVGEMIVQALRYYGGLSSTNPSATTKDDGVSMPKPAWVDPMAESSTVNTTRTTKYGKPICRPMNILALSSSALSFDGDDADGVFADLPNRSRGSLPDFTNAVGTAEGISGTVRSVGSVTGGFGETCAGKTVSTLASVSGVCPEAPAIGGSYKVAGAALYANTNRIRTPSTLPPDLPAYALKVKTYAASLAGGAARVEVKIPGTGTSPSNPAKFVYITPEGLWASASNAKRMPGAMLTFASISSSATHGAFIVTWNDSLFGGDYDMDIAGFLRYDILAPASGSTRNRLKVTTDIINVGAGWTGSHGFSIMGSNFDGRYLTHRHKTSDSIMSSAEGYLCGDSTYRGSTNLSSVSIAASTQFPVGVPAMTGRGDWACNVSTGDMVVNDRGGVNGDDSPVTMTFEMIGAENVILRDPLWYAAKYGAFTPVNATSNTELPDTTLEWDARRNDGKPCGTGTGMLPCADGEPDGYFLARRPELLEQQLRDTLETIISTTNAAPAVSSSQLSTGGFKYIATFEPSQNSGAIQAYALNSAGTFSNTPNWDSGQKLTTVSPSSRVVITNDGNVGKAWRTTTSFSSGFTTALLSSSPTLTSTQGEELINYLRGDRSKEKPAGIWRARSISNIMGTVVNSSPWLQTRPIARSIGALPTGAPSYSSFIASQNSREKIIWVGANDGMLHGFRADGVDGGIPMLSYIPSPMLTRLRSMAQDSTQIIAGMDGSPFAADVLVGGTPAWKTYLFSSLGRGGQSVFALDVTANSGSTLASALTESNAASIYKWIFSSDDDPDLGYVLGDHQLHPSSNQAVPVARMNNGKYAILVPNGLGSTAGRAYVFVLFVDGPSGSTWTAGTHYVKLPTDSLGTNGMVGVNWADTNKDGKADLIYGTDAQGRLWKFDVSSATPSSWTSAFLSGSTPVPLFEASSAPITTSALQTAPAQRLPVTTSPVLTFGFGGIMIGFGTGRSVSSGDFPDTSKTQRFYSIYDRLNWTTPVTRPLPNSNLASMLKRTVVKTADGIGAYISEAGLIAFDPALHDGWYINFPALATGSTTNNESVLSTPKPIGGQIFFKTVRPTSASAAQCYANPESMDYIVDPLSGLPEAGLLGTVEMMVYGVLKNVRIIGTANTDQKSAVVVQTGSSSSSSSSSSIGIGGSGDPGGLCTGDGCGSSKWATFSIIGEDGQKQTKRFRIPTRRQWREISGMRTDQ